MNTLREFDNVTVLLCNENSEPLDDYPFETITLTSKDRYEVVNGSTYIHQNEKEYLLYGLNEKPIIKRKVTPNTRITNI